MKSIYRIVVLSFLFLVAASMFAQVKPSTPPANNDSRVVSPKEPYDDSKAQLYVLKMDNLQLKANEANTRFQQTIKDFELQWKAQNDLLIAWENEVRAKNGWDDTYTYSDGKWHVSTSKTPAPAIKK